MVKRLFVKRSLTSGARTSVTRIKPGERSFLEDQQEKDFRSYIEIQKNGLASKRNKFLVNLIWHQAVIVFDQEYPEKVILLISREITEEFKKVCSDKQFEDITSDVNWPIPALEDLIKRYQDPKEADKFLKDQGALEEVNKIMTKNLDDILKRGEKIEDLMAKSKGMSTMGCTIYRKSKEANKKFCSLY